MAPWGGGGVCSSIGEGCSFSMNRRADYIVAYAQDLAFFHNSNFARRFKGKASDFELACRAVSGCGRVGGTFSCGAASTPLGLILRLTLLRLLNRAGPSFPLCRRGIPSTTFRICRCGP